MIIIAVDNSLLDMFVFETIQLLDQLENVIINSESNGISGNIDEIFRIMHTIKGSAAMMMFDDISQLAHSIEDLFFCLREEKPTNVDYSQLTDLVLDAMDFIKGEIDGIQATGTTDAKSDETREKIREFLSVIVAGSKGDEDASSGGGGANEQGQAAAAQGRNPEAGAQGNDDRAVFDNYEFSSNDNNAYIVSVWFEEGCAMEHLRAFELVNRLRNIAVELRHIPDNIDNEEAMVEIQKNGITIVFASELEYEDIKAYIESTPLMKTYELHHKNLKEESEESAIQVQTKSIAKNVNVKATKSEGSAATATSTSTTDFASGNASSSSSTNMSSNAKSNTSVNATSNGLASVAHAGSAATSSSPSTTATASTAYAAVGEKSRSAALQSPEIHLNTTADHAPATGAHPQASSVSTATSTASAPTATNMDMSGSKQSIISVNISKLDKLMDLVGELVTSESMVSQNPDLQGLQLDNFNKAARQLQKIINELQDVSMSVRMVPLSLTFQKMNRIVRDMCRRLGKEVNLEIIGEETEVDKNIIEHITNPLMHLIRNAVDHGIEMPDEREREGKPRVGHVTLEAKNESGDVWINVKDDGKGLNKEKIYAKAKMNGITHKSLEELSDREVNSFILAPGFSTNENVTEYSGRGVGMDVVVKGIENVGGSVILDSEDGNGTLISIKIPLTLAIMDGLIVNVGKTSFVIPITSIRETFKVDEGYNIADVNGEDIIMIRGEPNPIVKLDDKFSLNSVSQSFYDGVMILVENEIKSLCLYVDSIFGQRQVVVKPLPEYIKEVKGISGCTLLGDGTISLILDVADFLA
ncbi:MAG: chemotaxis protein CheA [Oscillospiraceae bacterium]|nr:chemotaxis protein CheA [Oscillospiraceae bacterium]